jgi:uracil-DNA glycosylase family 4
MSLHLDPRQRAMLREMGVRVWQPAEPVVVALPEPVIAIDSVADNSISSGVNGTLVEKKQTITAPLPAVAPVAVRPPPAVRAAGGLAAWQLGEAQQLYADASAAAGACWLVLAETPASALHAPPFQGDAGKLLDNMLRAAHMHRTGTVLLAPLVRHAATGSLAEMEAALSELVARVQPDVLLIMGRLAAQALLSSHAPFGKLRGQVHDLHGAQAVVTYDATYLLRSPADKAKAWDDLCLAMRLWVPAA